MAQIGHQSDEESHIPSVRSDNLPQNIPAQPIDSETLYSQLQYLEIKPNNHHFSFDMPSEYPMGTVICADKA